MKNTKKAFTLVELLIVIAIIGVLASLLVPALASAFTYVKKGQTKTLLTSITNGLNSYYQEYSYFPEFIQDSASGKVNLNEGSNAEKLVKALTGRDAEGRELSSSDAIEYNSSEKSFISFADENLKQRNGESKWSIIDAFGNPNIYVAVAKSGETRIKAGGYPTTKDGLSSEEFKALVPNTTSGVNAKAIAYTLSRDGDKEGVDYSAENVFTWGNN